MHTVGLGTCVFSPVVIFMPARVKYHWPNAQIHALMLQKREMEEEGKTVISCVNAMLL